MVELSSFVVSSHETLWIYSFDFLWSISCYVYDTVTSNHLEKFSTMKLATLYSYYRIFPYSKKKREAMDILSLMNLVASNKLLHREMGNLVFVQNN